jgi:hypothetical protein
MRIVRNSPELDEALRFISTGAHPNPSTERLYHATSTLEAATWINEFHWSTKKRWYETLMFP